MNKLIIFMVLCIIMLTINGVNIGLDYTNKILQGILDKNFEAPSMLWVWIKMTITIIIAMIIGYVYKCSEE